MFRSEQILVRVVFSAFLYSLLWIACLTSKFSEAGTLRVLISEAQGLAARHAPGGNFSWVPNEQGLDPILLKKLSYLISRDRFEFEALQRVFDDALELIPAAGATSILPVTDVNLYTDFLTSGLQLEAMERLEALRAEVGLDAIRARYLSIAQEAEVAITPVLTELNASLASHGVRAVLSQIQFEWLSDEFIRLRVPEPHTDEGRISITWNSNGGTKIHGPEGEVVVPDFHLGVLVGSRISKLPIDFGATVPQAAEHESSISNSQPKKFVSWMIDLEAI